MIGTGYLEKEGRLMGLEAPGPLPALPCVRANNDWSDMRLISKN